MKYAGPQITIKLLDGNPPLVLHGSAYSVAVEGDRVHVFYNSTMRWSWPLHQVESVDEGRARYGIALGD